MQNMAANVQNSEQHNTFFVPTKFHKILSYIIYKTFFVKTANSTAKASALKSSIQKPYKTIQDNAEIHAIQFNTYNLNTTEWVQNTLTSQTQLYTELPSLL